MSDTDCYSIQWNLINICSIKSYFWANVNLSRLRQNSKKLLINRFKERMIKDVICMDIARKISDDKFPEDKYFNIFNILFRLWNLYVSHNIKFNEQIIKMYKSICEDYIKLNLLDANQLASLISYSMNFK